MTLEQNNGAEHVFHVAEVQKDVEKGGVMGYSSGTGEKRAFSLSHSKALVQSSSKSVATYWN